MIEERDRCHAFSKQGERCELIAGHDDNHAISKSWSNSECWTPVDISTPEPVYPAPPRAEGKPAECIVCDHVMHDLECISCECRAGVPK